MANEIASEKKKSSRRTPVRASKKTAASKIGKAAGSASKKKASSKKTTAKAAKKTSTRRKGGTVAATAKTAAPAKPSGNGRAERVGSTEQAPIVSWQRRREMIAEAAYYKAKQRGFVGGDPAADWKEAEAEIDAMLAKRDT
jgi:hypothetical protein